MIPPHARPPSLIDTHAHLEDARFRAELSAVLERARLAGVVQVIAIGTTAADSAATLAIARDHPGIFAAVGVHPNSAAEAEADDWGQVVALAATPRVVALGETGLDRFRDHTPFPQQQEWFDRHLALADERGMPVVIHCRESERDIIDQLARVGRPVRGVLHSFTGTWDDAQAFLELGLDLSFAGMVTFTNRSLDPLREVAARLPIDRLLVETDSPYLSPHPHRGQSNEPARVALTAARIAEVRGLTLAALAEATTANARRLFALPDDDLIAMRRADSA
jgi:TatD DNase family protein